MYLHLKEDRWCKRWSTDSPTSAICLNILCLISPSQVIQQRSQIPPLHQPTVLQTLGTKHLCFLQQRARQHSKRTHHLFKIGPTYSTPSLSNCLFLPSTSTQGHDSRIYPQLHCIFTSIHFLTFMQHNVTKTVTSHILLPFLRPRVKPHLKFCCLSSCCTFPVCTTSIIKSIGGIQLRRSKRWQLLTQMVNRLQRSSST